MATFQHDQDDSSYESPTKRIKLDVPAPDLDPLSLMGRLRTTAQQYKDFKPFSNHIRRSGARPYVGTATDTVTNQQVVIKRYSILHYPLAYPITEVISLLKLRHLPCVIKLLDYFIDPKKYEFVLVLEYPYPCFNLYEYMSKYEPPEETCKDILASVADALLKCTESGYYYGALEPENVLFCTSDGKVTIKLVDFEACTRVTCGTYSEIGCVYPPGYRSPEQDIDPHDYEKEPAQIYSLDCILQDMVDMKRVRNTSGIKILIASMKAKCPDMRPSFERLAHHPWMTGLF